MPSSSITNPAAHGAPTRLGASPAKPATPGPENQAAFAVRAHIKENPLAPAMVSQEERRRTGRASTGACSGGSLTT